MGDEDAFLRAITAAPHDDAPRLVYADWLDETGHADRAEFLRLTCRTGASGRPDRLREIAALLDTAWLARVDRDYPAVDPYLVLRKVAEGTITTVYEAAHSLPEFRDWHVALRVLNRRQYADRFLEACRTHAAVTHARIPALYSVEERGGVRFAVRQFIDGAVLRDRIRDRDLDAAAAVRVVSAVAEALDAMHTRGVLHGNVHPRHILVDRDGAPWLIGLGEYPPDELVGNPLHLAPEQIDPRLGPAGPGTDVYQLAETVAWLLAGMHPFQSCRAAFDLGAAKHQPDAWRTGPLRDLPWRLTRVLRRALCPDPDRRHRTPGEFAAAFAGALEQRPRSWWQIW
jgi:uncharacterized protein (TIGR02996 family)